MNRSGGRFVLKIVKVHVNAIVNIVVPVQRINDCAMGIGALSVKLDIIGALSLQMNTLSFPEGHFWRFSVGPLSQSLM